MGEGPELRRLRQWPGMSAIVRALSPSLPRVFAPLRFRDFRLWWAGQAVSSLGNATYSLAVPFQVLALGGSPAQLGTVIGLLFSVRLVVLLLGGAMVDRLPKRRVILVCDLCNGLIVGTLGLLGLAGLLRIEHLYAASLLFGVTSSFWIPAAQAMIPELLPKDALTQGNALRALTREVGDLSGPVLGGAIIVASSPAAGFLFDALTFFVSFGCFLAASARGSTARVRASLLHEVKAGVAYTFSVGWLWSGILITALVNAAIFAPMWVALPVFVQNELGGNAAVLGLFTAALAGGQIAGTALVGQLTIVRMLVGVYSCCLIAGIALVGLSVGSALVILLGSAALLGGCVVIAGALWNTALQQNVPIDLRGRVASIDDLGGILLAPVAPVAVGLLVSAYGAAPVFALGGLATIACAMLALSLPAVRSLR